MLDPVEVANVAHVHTGRRNLSRDVRLATGMSPHQCVATVVVRLIDNVLSSFDMFNDSSVIVETLLLGDRRGTIFTRQTSSIKRIAGMGVLDMLKRILIMNFKFFLYFFNSVLNLSHRAP